MGGLSGFLKQNAVKVENEKAALSNRFLGADKKPIQWEIRCITPAEDEEIRRECLRRAPVPGKKGQFVAEVDADLYMGKLAAKCTVFPDLNDKDLQDSYGVMGAEELLDVMLLPGEKDALGAKVQEINGYDAEADEQVEEAKN